jgi:O-antigen ligase
MLLLTSLWPAAGLVALIVVAWLASGGLGVAAGMGFAAALVLQPTFWHRLHVGSRRLLVASSAVLGVGLVSWLVNGAPSSSVAAWLAPMGLRLGLVVALSALAQEERFQRAVLIGMWCASIGDAGIGLAQSGGYWAGGTTAWLGSGVAVARSGGLTGDPNYYALGLAMVAAYAFQARGSRPRAASVAFALCGLGILASLSRTGLLALVVGLGAPLVFRPQHDGRARGKLVALLLLLGSAPLFLPSAFLLRLREVASSSGTVGERLSLWGQAWEAFRSSPVFGLGPDRARTVIAAVRGQVSVPLSAHNTWLDLSVDLGILGVAAWAFLLFLAFRSARRLVRAQPWRAELWDGAFGALSAYAAGSLFLTADLTFPLWLTIGILAAFPAPKRATARLLGK